MDRIINAKELRATLPKIVERIGQRGSLDVTVR
jgi:hypothetical protein